MPTTPHNHTKMPTVNVEMAVPANARPQIPPKLLKNSRVCRENPDSKMMGGRSRKKKTSSLKSSHRVTFCVVLALQITKPTPMPRSSVAPASCNHRTR